jgi:hypothetical protein
VLEPGRSGLQLSHGNGLGNLGGCFRACPRVRAGARVGARLAGSIRRRLGG